MIQTASMCAMLARRRLYLNFRLGIPQLSHCILERSDGGPWKEQ
jgi:hypothetical protein